MNTFLLFLLKSLLVSAILTTWYWVGLKNKRLHQYNRFFLLFALFASMLVPLLHFQWFTVRQAPSVSSYPAKYLLRVVNSNSTEQQVAGNVPAASVNRNIIILIITLTISAVLFSVLVVRVLWILRMSKKYKRTKIQGVSFIHTDLPNAPFSFLNYLFWKDGIPIESEGGQMIFRHELTHIRQKHTYDKLACQSLTCIFWMNPFYWFIQKELGMIHEFIADESAISENDTEAFAKMLLQMHNNGRYLIPEHQFFSSPIKRRLTMLQTKTKTSYSFLRRMLVLPLIAGGILIFSFTSRKEGKHEVIRADKKIVLVVDAGHGGNDIGCQYGDFIEKDINLKIAKRIKELSPEYNVEVSLTRSNNSDISLAERVVFSNKIHPDYFISIHISDHPVGLNANGKFNAWIASDSLNNLAMQTMILGANIFAGTLKFFIMQPFNGLRNIVANQPLYVCRHNNAPSILMELGDIKNKEQMQRLNDDAKLDEICGAILKGVVEAKKS